MVGGFPATRADTLEKCPRSELLDWDINGGLANHPTRRPRSVSQPSPRQRLCRPPSTPFRTPAGPLRILHRHLCRSRIYNAGEGVKRAVAGRGSLFLGKFAVGINLVIIVYYTYAFLLIILPIIKNRKITSSTLSRKQEVIIKIILYVENVVSSFSGFKPFRLFGGGTVYVKSIVYKTVVSSAEELQLGIEAAVGVIRDQILNLL